MKNVKINPKTGCVIVDDKVAHFLWLAVYKHSRPEI